MTIRLGATALLLAAAATSLTACSSSGAKPASTPAVSTTASATTSAATTAAPTTGVTATNAAFCTSVKSVIADIPRLTAAFTGTNAAAKTAAVNEAGATLQALTRSEPAGAPADVKAAVKSMGDLFTQLAPMLKAGGPSAAQIGQLQAPLTKDIGSLTKYEATSCK